MDGEGDDLIQIIPDEVQATPAISPPDHPQYPTISGDWAVDCPGNALTEPTTSFLRDARAQHGLVQARNLVHAL